MLHAPDLSDRIPIWAGSQEMLKLIIILHLTMR
jgi:hypothetical protein